MGLFLTQFERLRSEGAITVQIRKAVRDKNVCDLVLNKFDLFMVVFEMFQLTAPF